MDWKSEYINPNQTTVLTIKTSTMMSKKEFSILACLILFCNCSNPLIEEEKPDSKTYPVQFSVQLSKEVLPYVTTKGYPTGIIPEPQTKADEITEPAPGTLESICTKIEYVVYKVDNTTVPFRKQHYSSTGSQDFGIIYDQLPMGSYKICLLAHSSVTDSLNNNILTFQETTDTFYKQITLEIGSGEEIIQDINLERIVGKLEFFATDSVHSGVKQFEIKLSGYPDKLNILTGIATASSDTAAFTHLFSPEDIGKINQSHSLLTFIPETGKTMSAKIKSTNHAGQLLRDYHIASVTPEINKMVRYSGKLYESRLSNDTFTLYPVSTNWGGTIETPLGD